MNRIEEKKKTEKKRIQRESRVFLASGGRARTIFAVHWSFFSLPHHVSSRIQRGCAQSFVSFFFSDSPFFFWITKSYVLYVLLKQKKGRRKSGRFDWSLSVVYRSSFNLWLLSTSRTYYSYNICSGLGTILRLLPFSCIHSRMRGKM